MVMGKNVYLVISADERLRRSPASVSAGVTNILSAWLTKQYFQRCLGEPFLISVRRADYMNGVKK